jgi:hypothetical protein
MMEYRNARYIDGKGRIDCEINHPSHGWIPFTASPDDVEPLGRELFSKLKGFAAPYVAPPPPPPPPPPTQAEQEDKRQSAYTAEADPLFFKWQAGEITEAEWLAKREEIRTRFPYPEEV